MKIVGIIDAMRGGEPMDILGDGVEIVADDGRSLLSIRLHVDGTVELSAQAFCRHAGKDFLGQIIVKPVAANTINIRRVEAD